MKYLILSHVIEFDVKLGRCFLAEAMTTNFNYYLLVELGCISRATDNFESFEFDMEFIENVSLFPIHVNHIQNCDGKTFVKTPEVIWSE